MKIFIGEKEKINRGARERGDDLLMASLWWKREWRLEREERR